jgi:hypothetical protein
MGFLVLSDPIMPAAAPAPKVFIISSLPLTILHIFKKKIGGKLKYNHDLHRIKIIDEKIPSHIKKHIQIV